MLGVIQRSKGQIDDSKFDDFRSQKYSSWKPRKVFQYFSIFWIQWTTLVMVCRSPISEIFKKKIQNSEHYEDFIRPNTLEMKWPEHFKLRPNLSDSANHPNSSTILRPWISQIPMLFLFHRPSSVLLIQQRNLLSSESDWKVLKWIRRSKRTNVKYTFYYF